MTEQEAKQKWCPFVRFVTPQDDVEGDYNNRYTSVDMVIRKESPSTCIASDCMAWRWVIMFSIDEQLPNRDEASGYCGLAGKT